MSLYEGKDKDQPWQTIEDINETFNSLSRISCNNDPIVLPESLKKKTKPRRFHSTFEEWEADLAPPKGFGRAQLIRDLKKTLPCFRDATISRELRGVPGLEYGFSNDFIEHTWRQNFPEVEDQFQDSGGPSGSLDGPPSQDSLQSYPDLSDSCIEFEKVPILSSQDWPRLEELSSSGFENNNSAPHSSNAVKPSKKSRGKTRRPKIQPVSCFSNGVNYEESEHQRLPEPDIQPSNGVNTKRHIEAEGTSMTKIIQILGSSDGLTSEPETKDSELLVELTPGATGELRTTELQPKNTRKCRNALILALLKRSETSQKCDSRP